MQSDQPVVVPAQVQTYPPELERAHRLEQYKIFVEMADRVSARRAVANTFFLTISSTMVTFYTIWGVRHTRDVSTFNGDIGTESTAVGVWQYIVPVVGLGICGLWYVLIQQYGRLNQAKYRVIQDLESRLAERPYAQEWTYLSEGKRSSVYVPLTQIEKWVPFAFALVYLFLVVLSFVV